MCSIYFICVGDDDVVESVEVKNYGMKAKQDVRKKQRKKQRCQDIHAHYKMKEADMDWSTKEQEEGKEERKGKGQKRNIEVRDVQLCRCCASMLVNGQMRCSKETST